MVRAGSQGYLAAFRNRRETKEMTGYPLLETLRRAGSAGLRAPAVIVLAFALACTGGSIEEIRALQDAGAFEESIDPLRAILSENPENPEASYRLGLALLRTGNSGQALWPLRKASDSEEFARPAGLILASTLMGMKNYEETTLAASRVLEVDPENEAALTTRAQSSKETGNHEESLADVDRLLAINAENLEALSMRAAVLAKLERWDEAHKAFDTTYESAKAQESPFVGRVCIVRAKAWAAQGDADKAVAGIEGCLENHKDNQTVALAVGAYEELERPKDSLALLRKTHEANPEDLNVIAPLAQRLSAMGEREEADALMLGAAQKSGNPQTWMQLAKMRRTHEDMEGAREALEEALALAPEKNEGIRMQLAETLIELGKLEEAEAMAGEFEEELYENLIRGQLALERGDPKTALSYLEPAIVQWPNYEGSRMLAARAASELGDIDEAMLQLREATRIAPESSDGALILARLYLARGEYRTAREMAARHIHFRGFTGPEAHLLMIRAALGEGQNKIALKGINTLANHPGMAGIALAELARTTLKLKGPDEAIAVIEGQKEVDLADDDSAPALLQLVEIQLAHGQGEAALARLDALTRAHPDTARFHALRGQVLARMGRPEAAGEFAKALELDPEDSVALAGQAVLARMAGDHVAAAKLLDRALQANPDQRAYAYAAAQELLIAGQSAEAERRLGELVHTNPEMAGPANDLAWILADRGERLDYALSLARRAENVETGPEVLDTLGWVYFQRGELEEARSAFEKSLALNPDYATARYHLGLTQAKQGDRQAALDSLRAAVAAGDAGVGQAAKTEIARLETSGE
jgi:tetratricopeptide (TPR) repeat protein